MKTLLTLLTLVLAAGCGSYASYAPDYASYGASEPSPASASRSLPVERDQMAPVTEDVTVELDGDAAAPEQPMVIYQGYLKLRVRRVLEAVETITKLTDAAQGSIDSQSASVIIVRIPASDFEKVMNTFAGVGELLDRQIRALDVTEQFTDLQSRLDVARQTRERLLVLLAQVNDVEERLRIIQEVKRLTELIESVESTLATLENLVAYYTITIELVPILDEGRQVAHVSPFPWIRWLTAHEATLSGGKDTFAVALPRGFVQFTQDESFRAQAADTTTLRAASIPNEPAGDAAFWIAAIEHEMDGRDEELVASDGAGILALRVFRNKDVQPRYYQLGVATEGDRLFVVEAFYPSEEAWHAHGGEVTAALASFRVAP